MSIFSRFALLVALALGLSYPVVARADVPVSLIGAPVPENNGYDVLLDAMKLYAGALGSTNGLTPADYLRFERGVVTRNRSALRKLREALALPILHPPGTDPDEDVKKYETFRKLSQLLAQEADVKFSDGDWIGAVNSHLDVIQMGVAITRGAPLAATTAGLQIEENGRDKLTPIIGKLSNDECLAMADRLDKIEAMRPPYSDVIKVERATAIQQTKDSYDKLDWGQVVEDTVKANGDHFTEAEKSILNNAGQDEITGNLNKALDDAVAMADQPYKPTKPSNARGADPWTRMMVDSISPPAYRVNYEWTRLQNIFIELSLRLRAQRLTQGVFPETIDLPLDPFGNPANGNGKLIYRRDGEAYVLYSVGANGKDDNGVAAVPDADGKYTYATPGDLLAPVFLQ